MKNKILFILTRPPYPAVDGTRERILGELKSLSTDFQIDLLIISNEELAEKAKTYLRDLSSGEIFYFKLPKIKSYLNCLAGLFSSRPLQSAYFYNKSALDWLTMNARKYQALHFHTLRFGPYLKHLRTHEIYDNTDLLLCFNDAISLNYRDAQKKAKGLWKLIYSIETERVKNYELEMFKLADRFSIVSERDKEYIQKNWQEKYPNKETPSIQVIRHGIEDELFNYHYQPETENLVFIGNLLYPPNRQGLLFFCDNILPGIIKAKPNSKLLIIGRGGKEFFSRRSNVEPLGFVDDPYLLMTKQAVFISPADFGAGVPTKSLLAMALGLPVISTQNNAMGIEGILDGENICLIDYKEPKKATKKIIELLDDEIQMKMIANDGNELVFNKYLQSINYPALKNFIQEE